MNHSRHTQVTRPAVLIVALTILLLIAACSSDNASDSTIEPERGLPVLVGRFPLPEGVALVLLEEGKLLRVHRSADGDVHRETLLDPEAMGFVGIVASTDRLRAWGATLPSGQLAVAVCSRGVCGSADSNGDPVSDDAQTRIFRSSDGGATWEISDALDGGFTVQAGLSLDELLLNRTGPISESTAEFVWWPSGEPVDRPGLGGSFGPYVLTSGNSSWWNGGTLVDGHRNPLLRLGDETASGSSGGYSFLPSADRSVVALNWSVRELADDDPLGVWRISVYEEWRSTYRVVDSFDFHRAFAPIAWLSESRLLVRGLFSPEMLGDTAAPRPTDTSAYLPAILDMEKRELMPLDFPTDAFGFGEQTLLVAAEIDPLAEIIADE